MSADSIGIGKVRGITATLAASMKKSGVKNSIHLLDQAKTPKARAALAAAHGVSDKEILELANRADLSRVKGIGEVFSNLLEEAGVDTVKELSHRKPENLHATLLAKRTEKGLAGRAPTLKEVTDWVSQAKELPKTLTY
jgi:predicted flap endonuclease-1-like 5' DNA nuclease